MLYNCLVILGPTASGKTRLACRLAHELGGEVISADSRQVYRQLNIGTGKDLEEYVINGTAIPYHLIDIRDPAEQYYLHEYAAALKSAFMDIRARGRLPVICGGTGLYLDALRKDYSLTAVPENPELRRGLENLDRGELLEKLNNYPQAYRRHVDTTSKKRMIRGLEVAGYLLQHPLPAGQQITFKPYYIGIHIPVEVRKHLIAERLARRLELDFIGEVRHLVDQGLSFERLERLGLEYKMAALYLQGKVSYPEMNEQLLTAIFQFAKRQMTWFRKMEKEGVQIHWVSWDNAADLRVDENLFEKP